MAKKETKLEQELGPKKYKQKIERENTFYDKYKAGRVDPKTGIKYNEIFFSDPNKKSIKVKSIGATPCLNPECDNYFSIGRTTVIVLCSTCSTLHNITHDKLTDEFTVEIKELKKYEPEN